VAGRVSAQPPAGTPLPSVTVCGTEARPAAEPPAGSGPVVLFIAPCFEAQGNQSLIEPQTYLFYIQLKQSRPSEGVWIPFNDASEKTIEEDFHRLWGTNFLDNLFIDITDYKFPNGTIGKIVTYNMEERQRVKIVDYVGSKKIEVSKIDEKLKDANAVIRLDTFIDPGLVRKVEGIVRDMLHEKGFQFADVTHEIAPISGGGPKLVHLTFHMDEGPKVKIKSIEFVGNKALSSSSLKHQMKDNKEGAGFEDFAHLWNWISAKIGERGTYNEAKFDDDAEKLTQYYRDHGYIRAVIGAPELKVLGDCDDKKTRFIELRIPVTEGERYKVNSFTFAGNSVVKTEYLAPLFKLKKGDYFTEKPIRKGMEKAREIYGAGGYMEFTGFPDYKYLDEASALEPEPPELLKAPAQPKPKTAPAPGVDVTLRIQEGAQYFVNRITFVGNNTTRDNVIRREMRLVENGVFNTEALKFSIKRLNQLGYFKPLEGGKDVTIDKTPGAQNKVDVKLKLEEQNRNQLTFGAGVSEFEGFFGQVSFQTANFLGRGESLTLSLSAGSRAQNYSLAFTEPFLFDRNITGGFNVFRSDIRYIGAFTQQSTGMTLTGGFPVGSGFTRAFLNYSYERVKVTEISQAYTDPLVLQQNPFLADSLLIGSNGERIISKVSPSIIYNTVDNPIFPTSGKRFTATIDLAGLGGNTNFYKPMVEAVMYWKQANRLTLGYRAQYQYIHQFTGSEELPIFEKLYLGGEYSVRGFDIRSIGPQGSNGVVIGGNKSLLFNVEEMITIAGPVRAILFYDAGEVQAGTELAGPAPFTPDGSFFGTTLVPGKNFNWADFKTSTGVEIRFFMPVLNVPFRLIFAMNPQRNGVLDNTLQPQTRFQFRFAVGSTF
jgi:outer membrane protein insertion porin family